MDRRLGNINGRFDVLQEIEPEDAERFCGLLSLAAKSGVGFETFCENFDVEKIIEGYNSHLT
jgi:hypothetical protein